jgi:ATP synthase protein I
MTLGERERMWRLAGRYASVGIEIAVSVAIGTFGGMWLDTKLGTEPVLFWIGIGIGVGAAVRTVVRVVRGTNLGEL